MSAEFRRKSIFAALICVSLVFAIGAWSGPGAEKKPQSPYNDEEYKEIIAQQVGDIYQLEAWAAAVQDDFMPILPPVPEFILKQPAGPQVLPFDAKSFPPSFVSGMAGIYENSVPVYPVLVVEDPATRALTFYNLDNEAVYTLPPPAGYDPFAFLKSRWPGLFTGGANEAARRNMMQLYDPARIQVRARLIDSDNLAHWIYTKRQIEASQLSLLSGGSVEMKMMLGDAPNSNIFFTVVKRATNFVSMTIQYPSGFTNGLDVFTCNDLMAEIWGFGVKNLATTGTNVTWIDTNAWVVSGYPLRLYAAADASTDGDGDGYADGREIMVYGTDPMSSNSHPVAVSGTISYSGIETGGVYVLFTQDTDSWSIAKSVWQASPGAYTNDEIGNGTSYWFKAFRDANGNFQLDGWEARGTYSNSATYVSGSLSNVDITMADVPSIWGQISYTGSATGDIHVLAVTGSNSWDETHSVTIPYIQSEDGSGGVYYVTFPVNYTLTDLPASNYWIRAYMDTDTNGTVSLLDPAGQYSSNSIPVSNRTTGINITMAYDSDGDGMADWWEMQYWSNLSQTNGGDADGDGLLNSNEFIVGSNPNLTDTDGDGMPDGWEQVNGLSATNAADAAEDEDGDGIPNGIEQQLSTSPTNVNSVVDLSADELTMEFRNQSVNIWKVGFRQLDYEFTYPAAPKYFLQKTSDGEVQMTWDNGDYWSVACDYVIESDPAKRITEAHVPSATTLQVVDECALDEWANSTYTTLGSMVATCTGVVGGATQTGFEHNCNNGQTITNITNLGWNLYWFSYAESYNAFTNQPSESHAEASHSITYSNLPGGGPHTNGVYTANCTVDLADEYTTACMTQRANAELAALGSMDSVAWGSNHMWRGECEGIQTNVSTGSALRDLSTSETNFTLRRLQYHASTSNTTTGVVYRAAVLHLFTPEGASTSAVVGVTNLWANGTGGTAYLIPTNGVTVEPMTQDGAISPSVCRVVISGAEGVGAAKYDVATLRDREETNRWTAVVEGIDDAGVIIKYERAGSESAVPWEGTSGDVRFTNGVLNVDVALHDGTNTVPMMTLDGTLLRISGVQQGDRIIVEEPVSSCRDILAVVKNFSWNDLQRLGPANLTFSAAFADMSAPLRSNVLESIRFCLDTRDTSEQAAQREALETELADPTLCTLDIASAHGVGPFPDDMRHFHLASSATVSGAVISAVSALDAASDADKAALGITSETRHENEEDRAKFAAHDEAVRNDLTNALAQGCGAIGPFVVYHTYEWVNHDPYIATGASMRFGDPIRNIKTTFGGSPALFAPPDPDNASSWFSMTNTFNIIEVSFVVNQYGQVIIYKDVGSGMEHGKSLLISDALGE